MKNNKEKIYTFRHWSFVEGLDVSFEDLKKELIAQRLEKGYVPAHFVETKDPYDQGLNVKRVSCVSAYAGKVTAPKFYEAHTKELEKINYDRIRHIPIIN